MSVQYVKEFLKKWNLDNKVLEFDVSSATVQMAAAALKVEPGRIAKTITFKGNPGCIVIVAAGDSKIDNSKFKAEFGCRPKMLTPDEAYDFTGYKVGGICPFGITNKDTKIYIDNSLKRFNTVYPACGSSNSAIELSCDKLFECSAAEKWIDVCKLSV